MKSKKSLIISSIAIILIIVAILITPKLINIAKNNVKLMINYASDSFDLDTINNEDLEKIMDKNQKVENKEIDNNEIKDGFSDNIIDLQIGEEILSINTNYNNEVYELESLHADAPLDIKLKESTTNLNDNINVIINGENIDDKNSIELDSLHKKQHMEIKLEYDDFQRTYLVQTLPSSFPEIEKHGLSKYEGDYYSNLYIDGNPYIYKMSNEGKVLFYKNIKGENKNSVTNFAKWNINKKERYSHFAMDNTENVSGTGYIYGDFVIMDENYKEIDRVHSLPSNDYDILSDKAETHDFLMIDDNHYMLLNYVVDTPNPEDINDDINIDTKVLATYVQEIKDDEVVWEWISTDYNEFYDGSVENNDYKNSEKYAADYMHVNSLFIDPKDDNLIMSFRNQDSVVKIDKETKEIMWTFGGKHDDFGLSEDQKPSRQHHATITEAGNLIIFDNGNINKQTRIIETDLNEEKHKIKDYKEFQIDDAFSKFAGSVQKTDEENDVFLIGWGLERENQHALMSEIDFKNDKIITEVIEGDMENSSYRFLKFK